MTPDSSEDDRTVIRPQAPPAASAPVSPPAHEDRTMAVDDRTQFAAPPVAAPAAQAPQHDMGNGLPIGTRLGEFELTSLLGEGGFGIVYLSTDHSLQRKVALKEYMPSALASRTNTSQVQVKSERYRETFELGRKSFINEARLLASFDHASLVKVYRFWEANGTAYMVMPFYEGKNLRDTLRGMAQPPDEAWLRTLLVPLTEALAVIHSEQCYHRDIAPDNVMMLAGSNRPLLLDFGAARRVVGEMTQALTVILKPGYAPVEQYAEIPGMKQGPWTDVYALAAVVHYAIMGKTPPPSVGRLLNDTYVPLSQSAAGRYSERFLAAVDRALAVRPEARTQSVGEFRADLGLGEVVIDPYGTLPLPGNTEMPARGNAPTQILTALQPTAVLQPPAAARPVAAPSAAMSAPAALATPAKKGNGAVIGMAVGAVVLGAVGFGIYSAMSPSAKPADAVATVPAPTPAPTPSVATAPAVTSPEPAASGVALPPPATAQATAEPARTVPAGFDVAQEFSRVVQAQTAGFEVKLKTNKTSFRIGKDELGFTVQSERDGFLYVFIYGADKVLMQLYPKVTAGALKVRKGQVTRLPQSPDVFEATAPAGPTELLVMVSPLQRDHSDLRPKLDGAYRVFPTGAEAAALAAKATGPLPVMAGRSICPASGPCVDEYGAALVRLEIVP